MSSGRSRRPLVAALLAAAGYGLEVAVLYGTHSPTEILRAAFAFAALWNALAAVAWALRARRGGPEARGFRLGAAAFAVLVLAQVGSALGASAGGPAGLLFPLGMGVNAALLAAGLLAFARRRPGAGRSVAVLGAAVFTGSVVLLLGVLGSWSATGDRNPLLAGVQLGLTLRQAVLSGVVAYLLLDAPRRLRGMLGWVAGGVVVGAVVLAAFQHFITGGERPPTAVAAAVALLPLLLAAGAWAGAPAEVDPGASGADRRWLLLVFVPFLVSGGGLAAAHLREWDLLSLPTLAFIAVAAGVVALAGVLLHELALGQRQLEARVLDRTRQLEEAMVTLVRTHRMNLVATLGAGATHDLKNLLGVIRNHSTVLREELATGSPAARESAQDMGDAADRASALVGRILSHLREEPQPAGVLDLAATIRAEERVLRAVVSRPLTLKLELPGRPVEVRASAARVEQILLNLATNACEALGESGTIRVRVQARGAAWALEVEDDGPGIPPEILEHLFEPLRTTRAGRGGTGLGLMSVKAMAEQDGGAVEIRSAPGQGTVVTVSYPAAA